MNDSIHRRQFIQKGAAAAAALGVLSGKRPLWADPPNDKPAIGIMGLNGRGTELAGAFLSAGATSPTYATCAPAERKRRPARSSAVESHDADRRLVIGGSRPESGRLPERTPNAAAAAAPFWMNCRPVD